MADGISDIVDIFIVITAYALSRMGRNGGLEVIRVSLHLSVSQNYLCSQIFSCLIEYSFLLVVLSELIMFYF